MKTNFDAKALLRLMKAPAFSPTDCPNFITYRDYNQYRWYARAVTPLLMLGRGGPIFVGNRIETLHGDKSCDTWMVVRYPSHRGMLRMITNPYYLTVANRLRERGTERLELAFTQPRDPNSGLGRHRDVLGLHVNASDADSFFSTLRQLADQAGLSVVYESEMRLTFDFIRHPRPVDPNPLTYPTTAAVAGGTSTALRELAESADVRKLLKDQTRACAQLYQRADEYEYLRFGPPPRHVPSTSERDHDKTTLHHRTCPLCEAMCGISVEVQQAKVLSIRGDKRDPLSQGYLCPKATALQDLHEDPDRLRQPMRREGSRFVPISWSEALEEASQRIHDLQQRHGRDAMSCYLGNPNVHILGAMMFGPLLVRALRTKNRFSATSVDQLPHMFAAYHMFGHQLLLPVPDVDRTDFMLMLGANPLASNGSLMTAPGIRKRLQDIVARGGEVIVIDPRRTETARVATEHHAIRPGSDALFLLSLLHVIFERGAGRLGRLEGLVRGMEALKAVAKDFAPAVTAAHTGIPEEVAESLATRLINAPRAVIYARMGASTQRFGGLCAWLAYALNAATGNLDREGGMMFTQPALDSLKPVGGFGVGRGSHGRWRSRVRGLAEFGGELPVAALSEEILTPGEGQVRGLITLAGNPVLSTPNGSQLDRALESLELLISVDPYINETTRHAHLILPPVSPLERPHYDLAFHMLAVRNTAKFSEALFAPPHGALDDGQIHLAIARRLATLRGGRLSKEAIQFAALERAGAERLLDLGLRAGPYGAKTNIFQDGLTLNKLRENPHGLDLGPLRPCLRQRLPDNHPLVNLAPEPMLDDVERLRRSMQEPPNEFVLIGRRHLRSNNSWLHNSERLMKGPDRCTLWVHPEDAARAGVNDGDLVVLASRVGALQVVVELTEDIMPGVVSLPHGFGHQREGVQLRVARAHAGVSANDLTDEAELDTLTGNAVLNGVPVSIQANRS